MATDAQLFTELEEYVLEGQSYGDDYNDLKTLVADMGPDAIVDMAYEFASDAAGGFIDALGLPDGTGELDQEYLEDRLMSILIRKRLITRADITALD